MSTGSVLIVLPPDFIDGLNQLVVGNWLNVATVVLFVYECLITLDLEIQLVWQRSGWSHTKIVYLLNRYLIIADFVVFNIRAYAVQLEVCKPLVQAGAVIYCLGIYLSEYILAIRVCVVWKMNKIVVITLAIANVSTFLYILINYYLMQRSFVFFTILPFGGCLANAQSVTIWISFVIALGYDTVIVLLIAYPTIKGYTLPYQRTELVKRIHVEGILFYFYLLIIDIVTVTVELTVPSNPFLFSTFSRILRSILASRFVLHILEYSNPPLNRSTINSTQVSELRFE